MGATYSSNTVDAAVNVITNVAISATQSCQTQYTQEQGYTICAEGSGSTVNIGSLEGKQAIFTDVDCISNATVQTTIDTNVSQTISQIATAISQAFELPNGGTDAQNVADAVVNIANNVVEAFNNTCKNELNQNQNVNICAIGGGQVNVGTVNFEQNINAVTNCVQNVLSTTGVKNVASQQISQKATAKVDSILAAIIMLLIAVIIVIVLVMFGGFKQLTKPAFLITAAILIVIYVVIAYYAKIWPFHPSASSSGS